MAEGRVRIAAVDMGSNTTRLIVADVTRDDAGNLAHEVVLRRSTITRLAEGVDARGILLPLPITRVRNALIEYRQLATEHEAVFVLATATSAVRDADNGEAFLGEVEHGFGFRATLLAGTEEAEATWAGVSSDPAMAARSARGTGLLVDIGGGSTEVLLTDGGTIHDRHSFQLGSVRVTERFLTANDPPIASELAAARAQVREELHARFPDPATPDLSIAVAGTATTVSAVLLDLPAYDPARVHGFTFTAAHLESTIARFASVDVEERAQINGLEAARAPVILGGLLVLAEVFAHFEIAEIVTSERDILDGIALMSGRIALDEGMTEMPQPFGNTVC
ncbi:MAG: Ppx/GppA family phosphatase [Thermoleophilia bacterium]|nr:Ppx/GppA family phosphatase [Thermoleophilia bacterium]MCZ4497434.1 Ppx/GppA family phosphatase [Thermoleophilia bacterium]